MAANDVLVSCFDPARPLDPRHAVIFTRNMRSGLRWSSTVPGGDSRASWTVKCDHLADVGFPLGKARILIWDPVRNKYLWRGVLMAPKPIYERGKLVEAQFQAVGCAEASLREFPETTVFGPDLTAPTVNGRHVVTTLGEIMAFGLTIADLVNGSQSFIAPGGPVTDDTANYRGRKAPQLWQDICNLTATFENPFIWMVLPDASGLPALRFLAQPTNPVYFEHGNAKRNELEIDYREIANQIYVAFQGNDVIQIPGVGSPIDYTKTPDLQTHFVDLSENIKEVLQAQGFAGALYNKFNQRVVTGGQITLDRDIRSNIYGAPALVPIQEIRAGTVIQTAISKVPYLDDVVANVFMASVEYNEDACETTISPSALNALGKEARQLASLGFRSNMTWASVSPEFVDPVPNLFEIMNGIHQPKDIGYFGIYFDPDRKPIPSVFPVSWTTTTSGTMKGSSSPRAVNDPPAGGIKLIVHEMTLPVVTARENAFLGTIGEKVLPQVLPDHRVNLPAIFGTRDEDGNLTAGERAHTDVQEAFIETLTVSTLEAVAVTVDITVDIWNWDLMAIREAAAFTISLAGVSAARKQYDGSTPLLEPVLLLHGDQLRWKISTPDVGAILNCCLSGWKSWAELPTLIGPDWVPGNQDLT